MQPVAVPPRTGKVAFQQGLIFGVAQAIVASSVLLVNNLVLGTASSSGGMVLLLSTVSFLTGLAAYFVAGIMGAKQTGKVKAGTFAGMWTGGIYGIIDFVLGLILFFAISVPRAMAIGNGTSVYASNPGAYQAGVMIAGVLFGVFGLAFAIGLGSGLGALGGLIGRNISPFKPVPAMVAYPVYPGQPYPGQPYATPAMPAPYPGQPYAAPAMPAPYPGQPYAAPAAAEAYPPVARTEQMNPEQ